MSAWLVAGFLYYMLEHLPRPVFSERWMSSTCKYHTGRTLASHHLLCHDKLPGTAGRNSPLVRSIAIFFRLDHLIGETR
ncbi:hypothetical protein BO94DRAFT_529976 [Aspergillus sclerotioniger CBS 115572]|uniref:Uncharacterized protein n=1 Tax=Aspergillus sclerotioniger CBS 115572 TaxID=1450535 RepID=A0A317XEH8_9EURO|nr:hypothetical protein BO94DRAFT_529976 [Aspergillus sclerotioniger CBS 115572]PWY96601.1 hypothetical protein BO94DRAFT_529976 [Aspergillus sclerotioniger CBS 115572]